MENWYSHFVPECFFDTVLFKKLLETNKRLKHTKGCHNVINRFRIVNGKKGDLYDSFGVGMVDKDKKELDYLNECEKFFDNDLLLVWKYPGKPHFIVQLNPPLEKWALKILDDSKINIESIGYSKEWKILKKQLKNDIDNEENEQLTKIVNALVSSNHQVIKALKTILLYLKEKNLKSDIEELKKLLSN